MPQHCRAWRLIGGCLLAAQLASCVSKGPSSKTQEAPTGLAPGDRVVIVLAEYREMGEPSPASAQLEASVARCVKMGMLQKDSTLDILSPEDCRKAVYPTCTFDTAPRTAEQLLASLQDADTAHRFAALGVRYVVSVSVNTNKGKPQLVGGAAGDKSGGIAYIGGTRDTSAIYGGVLVDVKNARVAAQAYAQDTGHQGGGVFFLYILPIPYGYVGAPGTIACRELGSKLAEAMLH